MNIVIGRVRYRDGHGYKIRDENRNKDGDEETVGGGNVGVDEGWKFFFNIMRGKVEMNQEWVALKILLEGSQRTPDLLQTPGDRGRAIISIKGFRDTAASYW